MTGRKGDRGPNFDDQRARQATMVVIKELSQEKDNNKRAAIEERLASKLSPESQEHLKSLAKSPRPFDKARQIGIWIRDAMDLKVDPEELEKFFASEDKLLPDKRQELLDKPRAKMEAELKYLYFNWKLGIQNPGPMFGDSGDAGRMPWTGPDGGPPREGPGPNRPPGFGQGREPRPDGPPNERRQRNRPPRPPGDRPPSEQKPEAI
jgi:hypothetical protein